MRLGTATLTGIPEEVLKEKMQSIKQAELTPSADTVDSEVKLRIN